MMAWNARQAASQRMSPRATNVRFSIWLCKDRTRAGRLRISAHEQLEKLGARSGGNPDMLHWIIQILQKVRRWGSVCTGAFLLAEAGCH
jgi:transcriptional regulator GlxA family with amidase domain